jgi:hypothetical protein
MTQKVQNLVVDYEDQADWLQDSVVLENVVLDGDHDALIIKLEKAVYKKTREMYNPPSKHIRVVGYAPADADVSVKRGLNFWTDDDNIFA